MFTRALFTILALASPAEPEDLEIAAPLSLTDYLDVVCVDLPDEACAPLYAMVEALRTIIGPAPKEWCCESCGSGQGKVDVSCTGCREKGAWRCGSMRHSKRATVASCSDPYTYDESSGVLNCY